ncbi:MAG: hypothetical protein R6W99_04185 [Clostridia bacterium]
MTANVFYYSRTGNSRRIAGKIAGKLMCPLTEIIDARKWKGFFGYMAGGYYSMMGKTTSISYKPDADMVKIDTAILVVPLWAGNIAPAGLTMLQNEKGRIKKLFMVINSDGSGTGRAFEKLGPLTDASAGKYGITKKLNNEDEVVARLCADVKELK